MFDLPEPLDTILRALLLSTVAIFWIITVVRIVGLRSFTKMTAFDFVVTIAIGSLLVGASQATPWTAFLQAALAMASLPGIQYLVARLRRTSDRFEAAVQNSPVLLMRDGEILPKPYLITHEPQPVSAGDKAWAGFGRWPR